MFKPTENIVKPASTYQFELIALSYASLFYELQSNRENYEHQLCFWNVIVLQKKANWGRETKPQARI